MPNETSRSDGVTLDQLFSALSHPLRLQILTKLARESPRGDATCEPSDFTDHEEPPRRVRTRLHHAHLPRLVDANLVEWDPETETITPGPHFSEAVPLLRFLVDRENELPDVSS